MILKVKPMPPLIKKWRFLLIQMRSLIVILKAMQKLLLRRIHSTKQTSLLIQMHSLIVILKAMRKLLLKEKRILIPLLMYFLKDYLRDSSIDWSYPPQTQ